VAAVRAIAGANLRRTFADRRVSLFTLFLPALIMLLVGTIFGSDRVTLTIGLVRHDDSPLARQLQEEIATTQPLKVRRYDTEEQLRRALRRNALSAAAVVPAGYGTTLRAGWAPEVVVLDQPGRPESVAARVAVAEVLLRSGGLVNAARLISANKGSSFEDAMAEARRMAPRQFFRADYSPFSYTAASNVVMFTFLTSLTLGAAIVASRRLGVTRRMLACPVRPSTIVVGEGIGRFLIALLQASALLLTGRLLFGVGWGDPVAVVMLVLAMAAAAAAAGLLVGTLGRSEEQVVVVAIPIGIAMAMLGGCLWPLEWVGPGLSDAGHLVPHAWAMDAWLAVIFGRASVGAIGHELAVLGGFTVALLAIASWRLRKAVVGSA
jgi:ABC-2 type transport system permease protein